VKLRNDWIDPLSLKSVRDEAIPSSRLAAFRSWRDELRSGLRDGIISRDLRIPGAAPESQYATNSAAPRAQRGSLAR
jgi:hypothetical protein